MAIHKNTKVAETKEAVVAAFVTGVPDRQSVAVETVAPYEKGLPKGNKRQISITIAPELLRKVDERADAIGIGRSAFISMALYKALKEL